MAKSGDDNTGDSDYVLYFVPDAGFDIRSVAEAFSREMIEQEVPLVIPLPNETLVEFEPGCTAEEIIRGYRRALKKAQNKYSPSNSNSKKK